MIYETHYPSLLIRFVMDIVILAGIPLLIATILAFFISFFQAITQIQDQTLSQTVKISAIAFIFIAAGTGLVAPLMSSTQDIFDNFHIYAQK